MKPVTIHNATSRMVIVPCNSGRNLFIAPRESAPDVPESEIEHNARVEKLLRRKAIVISTRSPRPAPSQKAGDGSRKKTAKKS